MADITLLHWNIENFNNEKADDKANGGPLINYIAWVVAKSGANIVSILETFTDSVENIVAKLIPAIDTAKGDDPAATQWRSINLSSEHRGEAYVVLYQLGNNFDALTPKGKKKSNKKQKIDDRINGLTNKDADGTSLPFNAGGDKKTGGRQPYYVAFETTDTDKKFTVVAIHVMYSKRTSPIGVASVGLIAQNKSIVYGGKTTNLDASMIAGDFNVYFIPSDLGPYENLKLLPSIEATREKTTLLKNTPQPPPTVSDAYRVNAYDNIFRYKAKDPPTVVDGMVFDLIKQSTKKPKGTGLLSKPIGAFKADAATIDEPQLIKHIPPVGFEDAWHIISEAISDHLPVYVSMSI